MSKAADVKNKVKARSIQYKHIKSTGKGIKLFYVEKIFGDHLLLL